MEEGIIIEVEVKEISKQELLKLDNVDIEIEFFWNSHGKKVPFPGGPKKKKSYSKVKSKVVINERMYEQFDIEFQSWTLFVNDELIGGEVESYNFIGERNILRVKVIVGWG